MWLSLFEQLGIRLYGDSGIFVLMGCANFQSTCRSLDGGVPVRSAKESLARVLRALDIPAALFLVEEYYTTKLCAYCNHVLIRIKVVHDYRLCVNSACVQLGVVHRDGNATVNIYGLGLLELAGEPRPKQFTPTVTAAEVGGRLTPEDLSIVQALQLASSGRMLNRHTFGNLCALLLCPRGLQSTVARAARPTAALSPPSPTRPHSTPSSTGSCTTWP